MKSEWMKYIRVAICAFILFLCIHYWDTAAAFAVALIGAASPLLIGCAVAYFINILMSFYERHYFKKTNNKRILQSKRPVCMLASVFTLLGIIVLIINLVVPELIECVQLLITETPAAVDKVMSALGSVDWLPKNFAQSLDSADWQSHMEQLFQFLASGLGNAMGTLTSIIASVFSAIITAFLSFIFAIYLLLGKEKLGRQCHRMIQTYLRPSLSDKLYYLLGVLDDCFHRYIVGQCIEAVILGMLCTAGMLLLRLPYATMIGALVAFTALIPIAGAYIGAGVGAFMILTISPVKAVLFLIFIIVLQQVEGNLIYPKVVGSSIGLPGIWVLAAITIGGSLLGVFGMLLAVPITAAIYRLLREDLNRRENKE